MFEQGLSYLLKGWLRDFIEDGDRLHEKVQFGLGSGYIALEDLRIKSSVLSLVDVPFNLQYGYIGGLEIRIPPWLKLGSEPVTVVLSRVILLLEPKYEWNEESSAGREQAIKQAKLAAAELFASNRPEAGKKGGGNNWFLSALLSKIIDNIQITVREVHIRYEDSVSCPTEFCFGFSFESLHLQSREPYSKYEESLTPLKSSQYPMDRTRNYEKELNIHGADAFFKSAEINHVCFYWNPLQKQGVDACCFKFGGRPDKEVLMLMTKTIATRGVKLYDRPRHRYILQPMDITSFFDCSVGGQKAHLRVIMADMSVVLEDRQMREIISFSLNMTNFMKLGKYSHLRPRCTIAEDRLAWFRYAANVVLLQVRAKRKKRFTVARFQQRIEDKMVYVELWRAKLLTPSQTLLKLPTPDADLTGHDRSSVVYRQILANARRRRTMQRGHVDAVETSSALNVLREDSMKLLHFLERELDFQELVYFRSIAEKTVSQEDGKSSWVGSIVTWATGGRSTPEEDRRTLYDALKFDPESIYKGGKGHVDLNEVNFIANVVLKEGSVTLALSAPESTTTFQQAVPFFRLKLTESKQKIVLMGGGARVKVFASLQELEGFELVPNVSKRKKAPDTIAHHILHRRNLKADLTESTRPNMTSETESNLSRSEDKSVSSSSKSKAEDNGLAPLFSCTVDILPPGNEIEVSVGLEVEEMEVWISPGAKWIDSMVAFSSWPEEQQYWSEMEMQAMNQLADLKARFDAKVAYMMENHTSVQIEGTIQAPVVVVHDSRYSFGDGKADILIVDLGTIYIQTEKLAKVEKQRQMETKSLLQMTASAVVTSNALAALSPI